MFSIRVKYIGDSRLSALIGLVDVIGLIGLICQSALIGLLGVNGIIKGVMENVQSEKH